MNTLHTARPPIVLQGDPIAELPRVLELRLATAGGNPKVNSPVRAGCGRMDGRKRCCADTARVLDAEWPEPKQWPVFAVMVSPFRCS
jgi:hypothetical protein